ncbi:MAG TPA: helix-turn-helix domain-containing protein [Pyrinomonadaceae bacterium]|jgi:tetratricopeptide (TPR) repeat protein|nr:helix-turn-helix domain-containing protein [Pyrinomonadaceae bacterium]
MTLAEERLKELDNPSLTPDERAMLRSEVAADLIHKGQYEAAREALGELWRGVGERPNLEGLGDRTAAEVLLQAGVLSGWLGANKSVEGAQDASKDLISESAALFEKLGESNRAATACAELALCYWRAGAYSEARVMLGEAAALIKGDASLKAKTVLRFAVVETSAGRYSDAFHLLRDSAALFDEGVSHTLRGSFHNELALVLRRLGASERRPDYYDRAIIEYTAAVYHAEQAQHESYLARIENNLAFLLYKLGRYADAHEHLDRAQMIFTRLRDAGSLAQVDETRARVLVAEGKYKDADRTLAGVLKTLEQGDESPLLADALTVQGVVWARLRAYESSVNILRRAAGLAEGAGAHASAGQAILSLIEEHGAMWRMQPDEVYEAYVRADRLLRDTQEAEDVARLRACARVVMKRLTTVQFRDKNFTLPGAVHQFEAKLIERALDEAGGSLTKAARLLGISHQTLYSILDKRHKPLAGKRKPPQRRLKSIIKKDA